MFSKKQQPKPQPKMRIRLKTSIAGHAEPLYGLSDFMFKPGEVVELDARLAEAWCASGVAEAV